jgi:uncharacterized protein (TIGR02270 family)
LTHDIREGLAPEDRLAAPEEPALWDVVDELLGEAEFLLEQWLAATGSLRFNLDLLQASIEPRLAAQLDALAVGGQAVAARVLWPTLIEDGDASVCRRAAAGLALLWEPDGDACDRLIALLDSPAEAKLRRAVGLALRLTARGDIVARMLRALAAAKTIDARVDLIAALSARGAAPHPIEALDDLVASATDESLSACLGALAAVQHARDKYRSLVERCLSHPAQSVRSASLRTGLIWHLRLAWKECLTQSAAGTPSAMAWAASLDGRETLDTLVAALERPERRAGALFALGFTGQVDAVDACLRHLDHEHRPTARWAVEAISHITGLPLEDDRFAQLPKPPNEEEHAGPTDEDDLEEDLTLAPTEGLPNPAPDSIRAWWAERRSSFDSQQRYLRGRSFSSAALEATCGNWPLHRFGSIVSEIAIRTSGELVFEPLRLGYERLAAPSTFAPRLSRPPDWR